MVMFCTAKEGALFELSGGVVVVFGVAGDGVYELEGEAVVIEFRGRGGEVRGGVGDSVRSVRTDSCECEGRKDRVVEGDSHHGFGS